MALRTLDSLGDLAGKRVIVRCDLNVPLSDGSHHRRRPRSRLPHDAEHARSTQAPASSSSPPRPPRRRGEARVQPRSRRPAARRTARQAGGFAPETIGTATTEAVHGPRTTVRSRCSRTSASRPPRRRSPTTRGVHSRRSSPNSARPSSPTGSASSTGSRRVSTTSRSSYPAPPAASSRPSSTVLDRLTENPERPYTVVLGGSKVSDKLGVIEHLLPRVDNLLIGGGMLFTFLKAQGHSVGKSLLEDDQLERRPRLHRRGRVEGHPTRPPDRRRRAPPASPPTPSMRRRRRRHRVDLVRHRRHRPRHRPRPRHDLRRHRGVVEDGVLERPDGRVRVPGLRRRHEDRRRRTDRVDGLGVVGGGDSASAVRALGFTDDQFGHISTGGGASLEFLEGKKLPGLEVLGW